MVKALKPFDIISAPYIDLDGNVKVFDNGEPQRGLFMVLAVDYDNITCCKITSQTNDAYLTNSVLITKSANSFLRADSYIQLDKLHTLFAGSANYLGYVDKPSRSHICDVFVEYLNGLADSVIRFSNPPLKKQYVSPNRK